MNYIDKIKINLFLTTLRNCEKGSIKIIDPDNNIIEIKKNFRSNRRY